MEPHNRQQMDHKRWYECTLASRQVSVLALCFLMKPDGIERGEWIVISI